VLRAYLTFFFFENAYLTCGYNYNYKGSASARYGLPAEPNKVRQKETVSSPVPLEPNR